MTGAGTKEQGPLPPLLLTLTVVTGVVDAVSILGLGRVRAGVAAELVLVAGALALTAGLPAAAARDGIAALLALAMGIQNAVARRPHAKGMPARPAVARFVFGERRGGRAAVVRGAAAARGERAAGWQRGKVRRPAADHRERRVRRPLEPRDGLEKGLDVRHPDAREQLHENGFPSLWHRA